MERETPKFDNWPLELGPHLTSVEAWKVRAFVRLYRRVFVFSLQDLEGYKGKFILIQLEDNYLIFQRPHRLNVSERIGVHNRYQKLLIARFIELSK